MESVLVSFPPSFRAARHGGGDFWVPLQVTSFPYPRVFKCTRPSMPPCLQEFSSTDPCRPLTDAFWPLWSVSLLMKNHG